VAWRLDRLKLIVWLVVQVPVLEEENNRDVAVFSTGTWMPAKEAKEARQRKKRKVKPKRPPNRSNQQQFRLPIFFTLNDSTTIDEAMQCDGSDGKNICCGTNWGNYCE
jgi:hypothetical protein